MIGSSTSASSVNRHSLNSDYASLNRSVNNSLFAGGTVRPGSNPAGAVTLLNLTKADTAAVDRGIVDVNETIAKNQATDEALEGIHAKLKEMQEFLEAAVEGEADGTMAQERLESMNNEFQMLGVEVIRQINDAAYEGDKLLTGATPATNLLFHDATGMSLTSLSDGASGMFGAVMLNISQARNHMKADAKRLADVVADLQSQKKSIVAFEKQVKDAGEALGFLKNVTLQITAEPMPALGAQANVSTDAAQSLLS